MVDPLPNFFICLHFTFPNNIFFFLLASVFSCIQLWNLKTTECINTFKGGLTGSEGDVTINSIHFLPKTTDQFVICNRSNAVTLMNIQGQVGRSLTLYLYSLQSSLYACRKLYILDIVSSTNYCS